MASSNPRPLKAEGFTKDSCNDDVRNKDDHFRSCLTKGRRNVKIFGGGKTMFWA